MDTLTATKRCTACKECHPLRAFDRSGSQADGYALQCKACRRASVHMRRYRRLGVIGVIGQCVPLQEPGDAPAGPHPAHVAEVEQLAAIAQWLERTAAVLRAMGTEGSAV